MQHNEIFKDMLKLIDEGRGMAGLEQYLGGTLGHCYTAGAQCPSGGDTQSFYWLKSGTYFQVNHLRDLEDASTSSEKTIFIGHMRLDLGLSFYRERQWNGNTAIDPITPAEVEGFKRYLALVNQEATHPMEITSVTAYLSKARGTVTPSVYQALPEELVIGNVALAKQVTARIYEDVREACYTVNDFREDAVDGSITYPADPRSVFLTSFSRIAGELGITKHLSHLHVDWLPYKTPPHHGGSLPPTGICKRVSGSASGYQAGAGSPVFLVQQDGAGGGTESGAVFAEVGIDRR